jgi:hypothetical protein
MCIRDRDKDGDGILDQYERDSLYYVNNLPSSMWDADNDGVPDWRDPSQWPQIGMTALKIFCLGSDPNIDAERYALLAGYDFMTGLYEPYDTIPPEPADQRFLMSSGPFDLAPDSVVTLVFAVMFADWHDYFESPDTALALVNKWAQRFYDQYWFAHIGIEENFEFRIANCEMTVMPNPVSRIGTVSFSLPTATNGSLKWYNIAGQLVRNLVAGGIESGHHIVSLDTADLPQGAYFLVLEAGDFSASRSLVVLR